MSFVKRTITDRAVEHPKRYKLNSVVGEPDTYDLEAVTGTVVEEGTFINKAYLDPLEIALDESYNAVFNSFFANLPAYLGNTGEILDNGQDASLWAVGGTPVDDPINYVLEEQSVKFTTVNGTISCDLNNLPSVDYSKFKNGEDITDDDYYTFALRVEDSSLVSVIQVRLCSTSPTFDNSNYLRANFSTIDTDGFKIYYVKKSELLQTGVGADLSNIQSLRFYISATGVTTVNWQYDQPVKADPSLTYPNPFQRNGDIDFSINVGDWTIIQEFGKTVIREIGQRASTPNALLGNKLYNDFVIDADLVNSDVTGNRRGIVWYINSSNYLRVTIQGNNLRLIKKTLGVIEDIDTPFNVTNGREVHLHLEKFGSNVVYGAYEFGNESNGILLTDTTSLTDAGALALESLIGDTTTFLSASITQVNHANHANIAEKANGLKDSPDLYGTPKFKKLDDLYAGGELSLERGTQSTLDGDVSIDLFQQVVRIFENGGTFRGAQLNLEKMKPIGVSEIWAGFTGTVTLPTTGWVASSLYPDFNYYKDLTVLNVGTNDWIDVIPANDDVGILRKAGIGPTVLTGVDTITIWAKRVPTASTVLVYKVTKG